MGSDMTSVTIAVPRLKWRPMSGKGMMWMCIAFGCVIAIIAFVLAVLVYFRERADHRHLRTTACQSRACCCKLTRELASLTARVATGEANAQSVLGEWSYTDTTATGTNAQQPMLLSAATPIPTAPLTDAQAQASSIIPAPFAGTLTALTVEANAIPTAGSATFVVTINGLAATLSATLDSTATVPFATATDSVAFAAGDLIGVAFSTTDLALAAPPTFTAQLFANFTI